MRRLVDFLAALAGALLLVAGLLALLFLAGCANGVSMNDDEARACRDAGCTAWTDGELRQLVQRAGMEGYYRGWKDANKQGGRGL